MAEANSQDRELRRRAAEWSWEHIKHCCCSGAGYVRVDVPVGDWKFGVAFPCICRLDDLAKEQGERLRRMSGMADQELSQWQFVNYRPEWARAPGGADKAEIMRQVAEVKAQCEDYARRLNGWLILQGPPGTGKTHLAYAIAGECLRRGVPVFANSLPDLLHRLRAAYSEEGAFEQCLADLQGGRLLVIDDLGAEKPTGWTAETLYSLINHRYARGLPLVVTTNADLSDDRCGIDPRILSRLREGYRVQGGRTRLLTLPAADFRPYRRTVENPSKADIPQDEAKWVPPEDVRLLMQEVFGES